MSLTPICLTAGELAYNCTESICTIFKEIESISNVMEREISFARKIADTKEKTTNPITTTKALAKTVTTTRLRRKPDARMLTLAVTLAITLATTAITPTTLAQVQVLCNDEGPNIVGTSGNDNIVGTPNEDSIAALEGNDRIQGLAEGDRICGMDGNDALEGGGGNDTLLGGEGNDVAIGGAGDDSFGGGAGNDVFRGGTGNDHSLGRGGNDELY